MFKVFIYINVYTPNIYFYCILLNALVIFNLAIPLINCLTTYESLQNYKNQQIFYIDYGDITSVHGDSLYVLPASLNLIDPLAYAVSLDVVYIAGM